MLLKLEQGQTNQVGRCHMYENRAQIHPSPPYPSVEFLQACLHPILKNQTLHDGLTGIGLH